MSNTNPTDAPPSAVRSDAELGPLLAHWYAVAKDGRATLCVDEEDARQAAAEYDLSWPNGAPHRAVLLGDVAAERDCRTCSHFRGTLHCHAVLRCVGGSSYLRGGVIQLWEVAPVDAGF